MNWTAGDFVFAFILLGSVGVSLLLIVRSRRGSSYRLAAILAVAAAFLLTWITPAVGIIGTEANPANGLFLLVLATAITGAAAARFRPMGMARAMFATSGLQAMIGVLALLAGLGADGASWPYDVLFATIFFSVLWAGSGWLFRRAAARPAVQRPPQP